MFKKNLLVAMGFLVSFAAANSSAEIVYSNQTIGGTNITSAGGMTTISGPNGVMILNNTADTFGGTWSGGMNVTLSRVLSGEHLPSKLVIGKFDVKMNDGEEMTVLAITAEEQNLTKEKKSEIVWARAAQICAITKTHPHALNIETSSKWFKGLLLDLNAGKSAQGAYQTYSTPSMFSGARYFTEITCGIKPRGY